MKSSLIRRPALMMALALPLTAAAAQRIVSIGGDVTEIAFALGAGDEVIARDSTSLHPEAVKKLPDVGYMRQLNAEGILVLKPTLVLTTELAQPALVLKQLADSGVNVVSVPGDTTLQAVPQKIATIAAALQRVEQGKQLSERYQQQLAAVDTSPLPVKVLFVMSHGGITPMAAGQHTAADAVIAAAGLKTPCRVLTATVRCRRKASSPARRICCWSPPTACAPSAANSSCGRCRARR